MRECKRQTLQPGGRRTRSAQWGQRHVSSRRLAGQCTYRFPATSSTCSSAVWASSGGRTARRLSLKERTLSATQPPISGGSTSRRFRSTLRLVSLLSFPRERGRAWPGGGRVRGRQKLDGGTQKGDDSPLGQSLPHNPHQRWNPQAWTYRQQVLSEDQLRQVLTIPNGLSHLAQAVLVHLQDGQLLQLAWCWGDMATGLSGVEGWLPLALPTLGSAPILLATGLAMPTAPSCFTPQPSK